MQIELHNDILHRTAKSAGDAWHYDILLLSGGIPHNQRSFDTAHDANSLLS
jgi:hypothetical protein